MISSQTPAVEKVKAAAKYYLQFVGQRGTEKQIAWYMASYAPDTIIRMATDRGWTA